MINLTKVQLRATKDNAESTNEQMETVLIPVYERMETNLDRVVNDEERQKNLLEAQLEGLRVEVSTLTEQIADARAHIEKLEDILSKRLQQR